MPEAQNTENDRVLSVGTALATLFTTRSPEQIDRVAADISAIAEPGRSNLYANLQVLFDHPWSMIPATAVYPKDSEEMKDEERELFGFAANDFLALLSAAIPATEEEVLAGKRSELQDEALLRALELVQGLPLGIDTIDNIKNIYRLYKDEVSGKVTQFNESGYPIFEPINPNTYEAQYQLICQSVAWVY